VRNTAAASVNDISWRIAYRLLESELPPGRRRPGISDGPVFVDLY
jgi:hypothetical protein